MLTVIIYGSIKKDILRHIEYAIIDDSSEIIEEKTYSENLQLTKKHLLYKHICEKSIIVNDDNVINYLFSLYNIEKPFKTFDEYDCQVKTKISAFLKIYKSRKNTNKNDNIKMIIDEINDDIDNVNNDNNIMEEQMKILHKTIKNINEINMKKKDNENIIMNKISELERKIEIIFKKNIIDENNFKIISFESLDNQIDILKKDQVKLKEKEDKISILKNDNERINYVDEELKTLMIKNDDLLKKITQIDSVHKNNKDLKNAYIEKAIHNEKCIMEMNNQISKLEDDNLKVNELNRKLDNLVNENNKLKEKEKIIEQLSNENKKIYNMDILINKLKEENVQLEEKESELDYLFEHNRKLKKTDFDLFEVKLAFKNSKITLNLFIDKTMIYNINDFLNYIKNKFDEEFSDRGIFVNDIEWVLLKLFKRNDMLFNYIKHESYIVYDKIDNECVNITILNFNVKLLRKIKTDHQNEINIMNDKYVKLLENNNHDPLICMTCYQQLRNCIIIPCNHVCICMKCYKHNNIKKCPVCRIDIFDVQTIYIS